MTVTQLLTLCPVPNHQGKWPELNVTKLLQLRSKLPITGTGQWLNFFYTSSTQHGLDQIKQEVHQIESTLISNPTERH